MKKRYIRNDVVFDPNIEHDIMGDDSEARTLYRKGRKKRQQYFGI